MRELLRSLVGPVRAYWKADREVFLHENKYQILHPNELEKYSRTVEKGDRILKAAILIAAGVGLLETWARLSADSTHFPRHK